MAWKDDYSWRKEQGGSYGDDPVGTQMGIGSFLRQNPGDVSRIPDLSFMQGGGEDWGDYGQWKGMTWDPTLLPDYINETDYGTNDDDNGGNWWETGYDQPSADYDWSLGFRPVDMDPSWLKPGTEQGLPGLAESGVNWREWKDEDWAKHFGDFPEIGPLGGSGLLPAQSSPGILGALEEAGDFTYKLDPYDTRMQSEGYPDYNIYRGGNITPYALRRAAADDGGGNGNGNGGTKKKTIINPTITTGPGDAETQPGVLGGEDLYPKAEGLLGTGVLPYEPIAAPILPDEFQEIYTNEVATDPLSRLANLGIETMIRSGGVAPTPFTAQAEEKLSEIMDLGGATAPTESEASIFKNLSDVVSDYGEAPSTTLESETQALLRELLESGGRIPSDQDRLAMQIETARSPIDRLRAAQLSQGQAAMADRGLLGQGPELDFMQRMESRLAPMYADAAQQISLEESDMANERYQQALQQLNQQAATQRLSTDQRYQQARTLQTEIALDRARRQDARLMSAVQQSANLSTEQSRNTVDAINSLTGIQQMRTDSALEVLDRNMEWNKFLAEFGLERAKTMEQLQQGRMTHLMPMVQEYFKAAALSAGGFVTGSK
jgi:hypothetical protein